MVIFSLQASSLSNMASEVTPKPSLGKKSKSLTSGNTLTINSSSSSGGVNDKKKPSQLKRIKVTFVFQI